MEKRRLKKILKTIIEGVLFVAIMMMIVIPTNITRHYTEIYR